MKKNTIKVLMVCLSILFSLACVDHFTCVDAHCEDSFKGYWDSNGQYHELPPEKELTPEEELAKRIENSRRFGFSEEDIQEIIPTWRKELGLDSSAPSTGSASTSSSNQAPAKATPSYTKEQIEAAWEETGRVEATCKADGSISYKNSLTGKTKTEKIPATGHKEGAPVVTKKAGLFSEGELTVYCETCGAVMSTEVIPQTCPLALWQIIVIAVGIVALTVAAIMMTKRSRVKVCLQ